MATVPGPSDTKQEKMDYKQEAYLSSEEGSSDNENPGGTRDTKKDIETMLKAEIAALRKEIKKQWAQPKSVFSPTIKLKEIVETVPVFDGHNLSVLQFTRACKRALAMLPTPTPTGAEENLVRMIKAKLQGHAYLVVEDELLTTVEQLSETLQTAFLPNRSTNYYRGELHNLYKKYDEHVLDYISRTKDLRQAILDTEGRAFGQRFTPIDRARVDYEVQECFLNGLPPELRVQLKVEDCPTVTEAFRALLKINQLAERDIERKQLANKISPKHNCTHCGKAGHKEETCWHKRNASPAVDPINTEITCHYCKKPGHMKFNCEARRINTGNISGNSQGSHVPWSARVAAQSNQRSNNPLPCSSTAET